MKNILITMSFLVVGTIACTEANRVDISKEEEKIKDLFQTWIQESSDSGETETYFQFVTDDFMLSTPNSEVNTNVKDIEMQVSGLLANNSLRLEDWESDEIIIRGNIAVHRHSGIMVISSKLDSTAFHIRLKYLDILRKDNTGKWKIYYHSNMPVE